jgi:membrane-associated phospholipid phosphatase
LRIALGVGISLSTLFTKQHLLPDVIGGVFLAWFCVWLTGKFIARLPDTPPAPRP